MLARPALTCPRWPSPTHSPARQPVLITVEEQNANSAQVLFLVGGAGLTDWAEGARPFMRIVLLFDGRDPQALASARIAWSAAKAADLDVTYWKEDAAGKWQKQA